MPKVQKVLKSDSKLKVKKLGTKTLLAKTKSDSVVSKKIIPVVSRKSKQEEILASKKTVKITPKVVPVQQGKPKIPTSGLTVVAISLLILNLFMMFFVGAILSDSSNRIALQVNNLLSRVDILESRNIAQTASDKALESTNYQAKFTPPDKIVDHYFGDENARYVWINFSDLQCPYSSLISPQLTALAREDKTVAIVNRHYPLIGIHPLSVLFSEAAECASQGDEAKFWQMSELIYQNQNNLDFNKLVTLAESIGVDKDQFVDCLNNHQSLPKIQLDYVEAVAVAGQNGTPTGVLYDTQTGRNKLVVGFMPKAQIKLELQKFIGEGR
ncbi:MAG: thioredoxin domain-containing protein [bacterium]